MPLLIIVSMWILFIKLLIYIYIWNKTLTMIHFVDCTFQDKFEDIKGVIRSRKLKTNGQWNDQKKKQ